MGETLCVYCGNEIEFEATRGKARKFCDVKCRGKERARRAREALTSGAFEQCRTEGFSKPANRVGAGLCEACYARKRRKGTTRKTQFRYKRSNQAGYIKVKEPLHTLADSTGTVYEHRFVYHKHNGGGPFECYWCGCCVTWFDMHVDHVDSNVTNNSISNLVASCPLCNQKRGRGKMRNTKRSKGVLITYDGETMCLSEWAKRIEISRTALRARLDSGWPVERALTTPRGNTGPMTAEGRRRKREE